MQKAATAINCETFKKKKYISRGLTRNLTAYKGGEGGGGGLMNAVRPI